MDRLSKMYDTLKSEGRSTEDALNGMVLDCNILLRGSTSRSDDEFIRPTDVDDRYLYATNMACIAMLNALFSKEGLRYPALVYPFYIDEKHPMKLEIHGINKSTLRESGFVYLISERAGFFRTPVGSWQYAKMATEAKYESVIEVMKKDFNYPVFDMDNGIRLQ